MIYEQLGSVSVFVFGLPGLAAIPWRVPAVAQFFDLDGSDRAVAAASKGDAENPFRDSRLPARHDLSKAVYAILAHSNSTRDSTERHMPDGQPNTLVLWGDDIGITNLSCYSDGLNAEEETEISELHGQRHARPAQSRPAQLVMLG